MVKRRGEGGGGDGIGWGWAGGAITEGFGGIVHKENTIYLGLSSVKVEPPALVLPAYSVAASSFLYVCIPPRVCVCVYLYITHTHSSSFSSDVYFSSSCRWNWVNSSTHTPPPPDSPSCHWAARLLVSSLTKTTEANLCCDRPPAEEALHLHATHTHSHS